MLVTQNCNSPFFQIISNEINGVDVDKWDYFARDCHHVGIRNSFDHNRFMAFMKVLEGPDGKHHLCVRDKVISTTSIMVKYYYKRHI